MQNMGRIQLAALKIKLQQVKLQKEILKKQRITQNQLRKKQLMEQMQKKQQELQLVQHQRLEKQRQLEQQKKLEQQRQLEKQRQLEQEQRLEKEQQKQLEKSQQKNKIEVSNFINQKTLIKSENSYDPQQNNKKYLVILACHCESEVKLSTIKNNIPYLKNDKIDIVVINSTNLKYNDELKTHCDELKIEYNEIPNDGACDFGKYLYVLQNMTDYEAYDYVVFTNDSYIIHSSIAHFFNFITKTDDDLYGYNDSMEKTHHIQSYLFALNAKAVTIFINNVENIKKHLKNLNDVIIKCELELINWFSSYACFLNISTLTCQQKTVSSNIFFHNDDLYVALKEQGLLPFTKLKRLSIKRTTIPNTSCYL